MQTPIWEEFLGMPSLLGPIGDHFMPTTLLKNSKHLSPNQGEKTKQNKTTLHNTVKSASITQAAKKLYRVAAAHQSWGLRALHGAGAAQALSPALQCVVVQKLEVGSGNGHSCGLITIFLTLSPSSCWSFAWPPSPPGTS